MLYMPMPPAIADVYFLRRFMLFTILIIFALIFFVCRFSLSPLILRRMIPCCRRCHFLRDFFRRFSLPPDFFLLMLMLSPILRHMLLLMPL